MKINHKCWNKKKIVFGLYSITILVITLSVYLYIDSHKQEDNSEVYILKESVSFGSFSADQNTYFEILPGPENTIIEKEMKLNLIVAIESGEFLFQILNPNKEIVYQWEGLQGEQQETIRLYTGTWYYRIKCDNTRNGSYSVKGMEEKTSKTYKGDTIDWASYNPLSFELDDIKSMAYIQDRSNLGDEFNSSWYIEDKKDIKSIMDCIHSDITFVGYHDKKNTIDGETIIVIWITLEDGTTHKLVYSGTRFVYEENEYEIRTDKNLLADAWWKILSDLEPVEVSGVGYPYSNAE